MRAAVWASKAMETWWPRGGSGGGDDDPRARLAAVLLLVFAFAAWNLTALAHLALGGLILLFMLDLPRAWPRLRRDPAVWVALAILLLLLALAARAALLLPETAARQWSAVWLWSAPLLFLVVAWWVRADLRLIHGMLVAALVGLFMGVARKSDWSRLDRILDGERYHFGFSALGLAFIVSVALLGLLLYHPALPRRNRTREARETQPPTGWPGWPVSLLRWTLWLLALLACVALLLVLQARGAALALVIAAAVHLVLRLPGAQPGRHPWRAARLAVPFIALSLVAAGVLWLSGERMRTDVAALLQADQVPTEQVRADPQKPSHLTASSAIRLTLWEWGLKLGAAKPWLGWGPGSSATTFLLPSAAIPVTPEIAAHAPEAAHLHSVVLEVWVRFGLAGMLIALALAAVLTRAGWRMWRETDGRDPPLREWLALGTLLLGLFMLYDFRILHVDLRFFVILQWGILYSFALWRPR